MSTNAYCVVEVFYEEKNIWLAKSFKNISNCTRDFIREGSFDYLFEDIFTGENKIPAPNLFFKAKSDKLKKIMETESYCYNFCCYNGIVFKDVIDIIAKEYYGRKIYNKILKRNNLEYKAELFDSIKDKIKEDSDINDIKELINNSEKELKDFYCGQIDDDYILVYNCMMDFLYVYFGMINLKIDTKEDKLVFDDDIVYEEGYWKRYKEQEELCNYRIVFYLA